jgi:hypothetical protein
MNKQHYNGLVCHIKQSLFAALDKLNELEPNLKKTDRELWIDLNCALAACDYILIYEQKGEE